MSKVHTGFTERVRYILECVGYDSLPIIEPEGWNDDEKEISRNENYDGIFAKFSNSLKFIKEAAEFISFIYQVEGINAEIRLVKDSRNPKTDLWEREYDGFLDMSTYELEDKKVSIKFNSGGLEQLIKARESDEFELDRETDVNDNTIPPLKIDMVELDGRRIFLQSKWKVDPDFDDPESHNLILYKTVGVTTAAVAVPITVFQKSHEEATSVTPRTVSTNGKSEIGNIFFLNSIENRQLRIYGNLKFKIVNTNGDKPLDTFKVSIDKYSKEDYLFIERYPIVDVPFTSSLISQNFDLLLDKTIDINSGESLAFEFIIQSPSGGTSTSSITLKNVESELNVDEDSFFDKSASKFVLAHESFERLIQIISGKKENFYSSFFGRTDLSYERTGKGGYLGLTHGFWVRKFDKLPLTTPQNPNQFKPLTISLKDNLDSFMVTHNLGMGIEKTGFAERLVIEDKSYFYNRNTTIELPIQVKKVKRSIATKYFASSIEVGYDKGGDYDEAQGLDEFNAKSKYTTAITRLQQTLILISKIRWDAYGKEFARRKPEFRFATTDTQYDNDVMGMDLKPGVGGIYKERKWQDDFAEEPTGVYDPNSATNLRMSPLNLILKHGSEISAGLTKNITEFVNYASSTANSNLKTKLRNDSAYLNDPAATPGNGNAYEESGKIQNSDLKRALYIPEFVEFDHECSSDVMKQIEGFTLIDGKKIYNKYGLVKFINENGDFERGFLINLKPNGVGRWKLLKYNN